MISLFIKKWNQINIVSSILVIPEILFDLDIQNS